MKICLIGPGIMPIPPDGWGAVEMLIWEYYKILTEIGHSVDIININNKSEIINSVNEKDYDAVHLHYDVFSDVMSEIKAKVKIISSHYPYIGFPEKYMQDGYDKQIPNIVKNEDFYIFASSNRDIDTFVKFGADSKKTFLSILGVNEESYEYYESSAYDKTLCFSQIVERKRQYVIQDIDSIDFFGRLDDPKFRNYSNYKGEVPREFLNKEISKYSNFVLLSSVENTTPLVVKESLICGLGVVVSEAVALELDTDKDFISVIPEEKINDLVYLKYKIEENRSISASMRSEIRKYGVEKFGLRSILNKSYIHKIKEILNAENN